MSSDSSCWKGRRCLVTGGTGFIGSHLCARLHDLGARVVNADIEPDQPGTLFWLLNEARDIPVVCADLSNKESIEPVAEVQPEVVFHLAAVPYAPWTSKHPIEADDANVVTTRNVLEAARRSGAERFVLASSACFFGATTASPLTEQSELSLAEHWYTHTKRAAEEKVRAYHEFFGVPGTICRFVNVYGPGDRHMGRIVPAVCRQLIADRAAAIHLTRSTGESIFEFLYVDDAVEALLIAAERARGRCEVFHFAPGAESRMSVRDLAVRISLLYDGKAREVLVECDRPEKPVRKYLDATSTEAALGWKAEWGLDDGLRRTIEWYGDNLGRLSPYKSCLA
jgi:nucleoside-diphosphate-sugar epimerase